MGHPSNAPRLIAWICAAACGLTMLCGCAPKQLSRAEKSFLEGITFEVMDLSREHPQLKGFERRTAEWGANYFSYTHKKETAGDVPLFNPDYFWFKVSLSKDAVEGFDTPDPVLTLFMPGFGKYLKLRVRGAGEELVQALAAAVYRKGVEAGGAPLGAGRSVGRG